MSRNTKGVIGWSVLTMLFVIAYALFLNNGAQSVIVPLGTCCVANIVREIWQYKTGRTLFFEWDDIFTYSITIGVSAVLTGFLLIFFGLVE